MPNQRLFQNKPSTMHQHFQSVCLLLTLLSFAVSPLSGQNIPFTELENNQAVKNLQEIIKGVDNGFLALKNKPKLTTEGKDSSFKSSIAIFPARTKSAAFIHYQRQFVYYREETETDIYNATQALKQVLRRNDYVEIEPEQPGTYTFAARAFKTKNTVVSISYREEKERAYSVILIIRADHFNSANPNKTVSGNWEPEKKGLGFSFKANGKDSVWITQVFPKSPAELAGLKAGDLITSIDNEIITQYLTPQVSNLLAVSPDKLTLTHLRSGKVLKTLVQKDFTYKYDKTCLSGDCANGNGVAMSNVSSGILMEGKFKDGQLVDGSWYSNAKSLQEKGVLFRKGKVKMNRFFTGSSYDPSKPDGGLWYEVIDHDLIQSPNITEKTLHGYVRCYAAKNSKYLWAGDFVAGKRQGDFAEYLYDKGFYWSYYIQGKEKSLHKLKRITADKIAEEWLNDQFLTYNEATKTWSGWFLSSVVNSTLSTLTRLDNVSNYDDIERKALAARATPAPSNGGTIKTTPEKTPEIQVKRCGYCNGRGYTAPNHCHICEDTGWTNTWVGTTTYNAVRQICVCVGGGMMGYNYMKKTLENRKKICGYCNGSGMVK